LAAKDSRIAELEALLAAARLGEMGQEDAAAEVSARFAAAADLEADDLQSIHGIGPVLEGLLQAMNIRTFRQIAAWTADDVALVSAALDAFPDRIVRDDWIGGAREQHRLKYGEAP
jgi:predicted flap endonuclease-1-like 5' DNA nuclease